MYEDVEEKEVTVTLEEDKKPEVEVQPEETQEPEVQVVTAEEPKDELDDYSKGVQKRIKKLNFIFLD